MNYDVKEYSIENTPKSFRNWSEQRRADLTKKLAILAFTLCVFYIIFDYTNGASDYVPYYFILLSGSIASFVLLRFKKYTVAKVTLILSGLALLSILTAWDPRETGAFMFFLVAALASVSLFGTHEHFAAIIVGLATFISFYVVYFTDLYQFEPLDLSQQYIDNSFLINFMICLLVTIVIIYYIISISEKSEANMYDSQVDLLKMARDLEENRKRFQLAIKGSRAGIWDWEVKSDSFFFSPRAAEIMGYEPSEIEHMNMHDVFQECHPADRVRFEAVINNVLTHGGKLYIECRFRSKAGEYIWVQDSGQAEMDENGQVKRIVGSIIDINERKRAEEQVESQNRMLQKANEELDRFVYSTSHDLRAPLSSMLGLIKVAGLTEDDNERKYCIKLMEQRIRKLDGFIKEIINYSRNSRLDLSAETFHLKEIVEQIFFSLEYLDQMNEIRVVYDFPDKFKITTDQSRLKVVLNNLISNAIKYHDLRTDDPVIRIKAEQQEEDIVIQIEDNGSGIASEYQDKIFDMFYRATERSDGSGLGLYIAKEMVEKLNGSIFLISKPGEGSKFEIRFPPLLEAVHQESYS